MRKPFTLQFVGDDGIIEWQGSYRDAIDANFDDVEVLEAIKRIVDAYHANRDIDRTQLPVFRLGGDGAPFYTIRGR